MHATNIANVTQAKAKKSSETLFQKAYDLTQRIALIKGKSIGISEVLGTVVHSMTAVTDDSGVYLEFEKSYGGVYTDKKDIQELLFKYKSELRDSFNPEVLEGSQDLEYLLNEAQEHIDINGKKFLVYNSSVQHIFAYRLRDKVEIVRYTQRLDQEEVYQMNIFSNGTIQIINGGVQEPIVTLSPQNNEEVNDFFMEMTVWINNRLHIGQTFDHLGVKQDENF